MCYLELSAPLIWLFLFDRKRRVSWPDNAGTPAAPNAPLSMETRTCFDSSQLFVPSLLCVQCWSMWRPLALTRQATWFPHISSLFFPCGLPCQQHLVAWEGCGTSEVVGFGVEAWNFLPFPCFPSDPTPFLPQESSQAIWEVSQFIHRGVCTPLTWSQPSQAPSRGTTPAWLPTKASEAWLPRH